MRIGVPSDLLAQGVEPGVRQAFEASLRAAEGLGARVVEIDAARTPATPCRRTT